MTDSALLERPKSKEKHIVTYDEPMPLPEGSKGNRKPPNKKTLIGYARNDDDNGDIDSGFNDDDAWAELGLRNPFAD